MSELVTLIMPIYNAENFLEETIDSILNQTYTNWELLAINDNSNDGSLAILETYQKRDARIKVFSFDQNQKPAIVRNFGISKATGDFIGFIDADDICFHDRLEVQVNFFKTNSNVDLCGGFWLRFGKNVDYEQAYIKETNEELKLAFIYENYIGNSTVLARKKVFSTAVFNPDFVPMEDYELWTRIIMKHKLYNIQKPLIKYRLHDNNISHTIAVDYEKVKQSIQLKYVNTFGLVCDEEELKYLKKGLRVEQVERHNELKKIIVALHKFELFQKESHFFEDALIQNTINENLNFYFKRLRSYRLKFLFFVLNQYSSYFKILRFKTKVKFVVRSIFW
ncbi:glycosyltransferase [Flavobacterium sp. TP390]|uniref:Glycosyltransferase n=1 Tax=Flavobacterium profundi TaxID=1774945 RepID=A0A6I4IT74_9FLAO|nr:glycosyltransferase family 2 protein [Flavobacterium profundi]MVO10077.1 glycosyltransferase [Flavobacterium profundi]